MDNNKVSQSDGDGNTPQESPRRQKSPLKKDPTFDSLKLIERSQSDATLFDSEVSKPASNRASSVDYVSLQNRRLRRSPNKVSESSKVYLDLSNVDGSETDDDDVVTPITRSKRHFLSSSQRSGHSGSAHGLETIPQEAESFPPEYDKDIMTFEVAPGDLEHLPPHFRTAVDFYSEDGISSGQPSSPTDELEGSDVGLSFYTKYPLRFPHGYSLSKYRHNLKLSYQTLSQKLEQNIVQLRGLTLRGLIYFLILFNEVDIT